MDLIFKIITTITYIITIASIISVCKPEKIQNEWIKKFYKYIDLLALYRDRKLKTVNTIIKEKINWNGK